VAVAVAVAARPSASRGSSFTLVSDSGNPADGSFNGGNGEVIISYTAAAVAPTTTTTTTPVHPASATTPATPAPTLAVTGVDAISLLMSGGGLIAAGMVLLGCSSGVRRRRLSSTS
jgi:hypothetical protein